MVKRLSYDEHGYYIASGDGFHYWDGKSFIYYKNLLFISPKIRTRKKTAEYDLEHIDAYIRLSFQPVVRSTIDLCNSIKRDEKSPGLLYQQTERLFE